MRECVETPQAIMGLFGKYRPFSNFDETEIYINGLVFKSAEHAMHFFKTKDIKWKEKIFNAETPAQAKKLGRMCPMKPNWDDIKVNVVKYVLYHKFQNEKLRDLLQSTGFKYLEETNDWGDRFWGRSGGVGKNELGNILMHLRSGTYDPQLSVGCLDLEFEINEYIDHYWIGFTEDY